MRSKHLKSSGRAVLGSEMVTSNVASNASTALKAPASPAPKLDQNTLIWLQTVDGRKEAVEQEVAFLSPFIQREVLRNGRGLMQDDPVPLPRQVTTDALDLLMVYCRYHQAPGRSDKERKIFDEKFSRMDTRRLCELTSAADSLDLKPLVDTTSRALARLIEGKTPEEIRETFNLPDDLTEEEKLEPVKHLTDDPRIRLLNRLYAKKRKELAVRKSGKDGGAGDGSPTPGSAADSRSLEELLSFIEQGHVAAGEGQGQQGSEVKPAKKKKKKKGTKKPGAADHDDELGGVDSEREDGLHGDPPQEHPPNGSSPGAADQLSLSRGSSTMSRQHTLVRLDAPLEELFPEDGFDDSDVDEQVTEEVQDFQRRLTQPWHTRMQELMYHAEPEARWAPNFSPVTSPGRQDGGSTTIPSLPETLSPTHSTMTVVPTLTRPEPAVEEPLPSQNGSPTVGESGGDHAQGAGAHTEASVDASTARERPEASVPQQVPSPCQTTTEAAGGPAAAPLAPVMLDDHGTETVDSGIVLAAAPTQQRHDQEAVQGLDVQGETEQGARPGSVVPQYEQEAVPGLVMQTGTELMTPMSAQHSRGGAEAMVSKAGASHLTRSHPHVTKQLPDDPHLGNGAVEAAAATADPQGNGAAAVACAPARASPAGKGARPRKPRTDDPLHALFASMQPWLHEDGVEGGASSLAPNGGGHCLDAPAQAAHPSATPYANGYGADDHADDSSDSSRCSTPSRDGDAGAAEWTSPFGKGLLAAHVSGHDGEGNPWLLGNAGDAPGEGGRWAAQHEQLSSLKSLTQAGQAAVQAVQAGVGGGWLGGESATEAGVTYDDWRTWATAGGKQEEGVLHHLQGLSGTLLGLQLPSTMSSTASSSLMDSSSGEDIDEEDWPGSPPTLSPVHHPRPPHPLQGATTVEALLPPALGADALDVAGEGDALEGARTPTPWDALMDGEGAVEAGEEGDAGPGAEVQGGVRRDTTWKEVRQLVQQMLTLSASGAAEEPSAPCLAAEVAAAGAADTAACSACAPAAPAGNDQLLMWPSAAEAGAAQVPLHQVDAYAVAVTVERFLQCTGLAQHVSVHAQPQFPGQGQQGHPAPRHSGDGRLWMPATLQSKLPSGMLLSLQIKPAAQ